MTIISSKSFDTWLQTYEHPFDVPQLDLALGESLSIAKQCNDGKAEDALESHLDNPFSAVFLAVRENEEVQVSCFHHLFKHSPGSVKYDPSADTIFALAGVGRDSHVMEIPPVYFEESAGPEFIQTPYLRSFMATKGDAALFRREDEVAQAPLR